ncbi:MAG: DUF11 domain-containing protein, partial [Candidatus Rokubacteria bacterium]|nr:DUF11 domain-containing protein [Candidatus Rokubacteria bacterium]
MPAPTQNFDGVNNVDSVLPPDPNGDVGPNHYVQWVNVSFAIYAKSGTRLYGPAAGNTLWAGFGGPCESRNDGDPIALYDRLADRWLMSQLAVPNFPAGPFYQCIAVSETPDPTGAYYRYAFLISDTKLNDYPKFGVWPDAYYLAINQFDEISLTAAGQGVVAFERAKMLAGDPAAAMVYFDLFSVDPTLCGMLPSHLNGPPPPAGSPNYFVQVDDDAWGYAPDQLQVWQFHVDWADPANSTFTRAALLPTAPFDSSMCGYAPNCIPQRGTGARLDALSDRLMYRLQYRHFGAYDTLVVNHTVDVGGDHAGIRWYEIRRVDGALSIYQQGTYAPDAAHRWMGSIAMDGAGNVALGFSVSSNTLYPSIRYVGRLTGDPLGTLPQGETTLKAGGGSQTHPSGRWGDYSTLSVDPMDDCTFWYTQEYYAATRSFSWRTRIGSFKFPSCASTATGADLSIALTDAPDPVFAGSTLTYTITVTNNGPQSASGVTVTDPLPTGATFVSAGSAQGSCAGTTTITCALGVLARGARATVTLVVTPTVGGAFSNTVSVAGNEADPNPADNAATAVTTVIVPNPVPVVSTLSPSATAAGSAPFTLTVNGSDFIPSSVVRWNGADRTTSFVSPSQLEAAIPASDVTTAGTAQVTVFNPAPGGGTSSALTFTITPVLPGNETLSVSPTTLAAGGTLTATWSGIANPTPADWIGLYLPASSDGGYLAYRYTTGYTSGSVPFVLPAALAPGTYELRLFSNNSLTRLAVSNPFTVPAPPSLAVSPTTVAPGDSVTATWSGIVTPSATDWLGLFTPGAADTASLTARQYTTGAAGGSLPFPIPASLAPGTYELRLFANDTLTRLAVSNA